MRTSYATLAEAQADGWLTRREAREALGNPRFYPTGTPNLIAGPHVDAPWGIADPGRCLHIRDISGRRCFGYDFGVFLSSQDFLQPYDRQPCHLHSVTIWFSEDLNQMHQPGCFSAMFNRADLEALLARFSIIPPTPAAAAPVTLEELQWKVFRFPNWRAFQCPPTEREALAELNPATVRRMLEIQRRPLEGVTDELIGQAMANPGAF